jgi:hypothetical protein
MQKAKIAAKVLVVEVSVRVGALAARARTSFMVVVPGAVGECSNETRSVAGRVVGGGGAAADDKGTGSGSAADDKGTGSGSAADDDDDDAACK